MYRQWKLGRDAMEKICHWCGESVEVNVVKCPACCGSLFDPAPCPSTPVLSAPVANSSNAKALGITLGNHMRLFRKQKDNADLQQLMEAIDNDVVSTVEAVLGRNPGLIHAQDQHYGTALHRAAIKGRKAIVELLTSRGADVRARKKRHRCTPLHYAAQMGHLDIARLLISKGADVNARNRDGETPLDSAAYGGSSEAIDLLLGHNARSSGAAVANAVFSGRAQVVEYLLDHGFPSATWRGQGPLHKAVSMGLTGIAELLIRRGADVNVRDSYGRTPLHEAAGSRDEESGRVILSNFPINVHIYDVVTLLISKGADVNARDKRGKTPMDVALGNGNVPAVFALRPHGPAWEEFLRRRLTGKPLFTDGTGRYWVGE